MKHIASTLGIFVILLPALAGAQETSSDILIYGATPSGVMAAVAAARHGRSVTLIEPAAHVGGVVSGGLVDTDIGDRATVGGLADEFLKRIVAFYREKYGADSRQLAACKEGVKFEPHAAEAVFEGFLRELKTIRVFKRHGLAALASESGRITRLVATDLSSGAAHTFSASIFIDASYTGDVMATARVPYRVGREARSEYNEILAGVSMGPLPQRGMGDHRTQAYNYRVSLTSHTPNRVLFPKPAHYNPAPWAATYGERIKRQNLTRFADLYVNAEKKAGPNDKFDTNWGDLHGGSEGYAEGDAEVRRHIEERHRDYFLSLLYYLQNDPSLPQAFRDDARKWGLPADEFVDNGHFPFQLYVRAARRMVGRYVLRESDLTQDRFKPDGVCAGSYGIDCHVVQKLLHEGKEIVEHTRHVSVDNYDIPYACLTPIEPANLLVPVCLSTTHVAYCSLRMEPVFMMLGHAAGDAAHLALSDKTSVQQVNVKALRDLLKAEGAVLEAGYQPAVKIAFTPAHPAPGDVVKFTAVTGDLKDPLVSLSWDFEGTGQVGASGATAEHRFKLNKVYSVALVVEDKVGRRRLVETSVPVGAAVPSDLTMDEFDAELFGRWDGAYPQVIVGGKRLPDVFIGPGAHYDVVREAKKVAARARFTPDIPRAGRYQVCLGFRPAKNQASNVPIVIRHAKGTQRLTIDQRASDSPFVWKTLGEFTFNPGENGFVEISNNATDGRVVLDGVRWLWLGE